MRILHTADVHLGARFGFLAGRGAAQRGQLRDTFKNVVQLAIDHEVNLLLVAGDLFDDNRQSTSNIELVKEQFSRLAGKGIWAYLLPGTHDCLDASSIYRKVAFASECPNVRVFDRPNLDFYTHEDLGVTVYGKPNVSNKSSQSPLEGLKPATPSRYHIALAHGSLMIPGLVPEDDHVFSVEQVDNSGMDYIALGHWHRTYQVPSTQVCAWYSGPPEWLATDQRDTGSVLLVEIPDNGKPRVASVQTGVRRFEEVEIDVGSVTDVATVKQLIASEANPNLIRRVVLKGLRGLHMQMEIEEWQGEFADQFFLLDIIDASHPELQQVDGQAYPESSVIRRFVGLMQQEISQREGKEREVAEKALQYGVALLMGREVLE